MKLQEASKKEVLRMAKGSAVCALLELAGFAVLHWGGVITFSYKIPLSIAVGTAVTLFSFLVLCLAVQKAASMTDDQKAMKARMQLSYNLRLLLQAGWVVIAFLAPCFNVLAAAAPLLFPTAIIFYLQYKGKLVEPSERKNPPADDEDDGQDKLESFEI